MLAELMRFKYGIAIAGTHGKTTTTSLVASVLAEAQLDPTFVIGGRLNSAGSNARLGTGRYFVAEADESDASFLFLKPMIAIVTNIDQDHMSTYHGDIQQLYATFLKFLHHLPFYGLAVMCIDDLGVREILSQVQRPKITYGFSEEADVQALNYTQKGLVSEFDVIHGPTGQRCHITLNLPGRHNVLNALATLTIAMEEGVPMARILSALRNFSGIGRRFQLYENIPMGNTQITVVDDYGHHPTELRATIAALREGWPDRRLVMVFQPHRYTRTRDLFDDFVEVLTEVDVLVLLEVYSAGETPIDHADGRSLARGVRQRGKVEPIFVSSLAEVIPALEPIVQASDMVLFQGAGSVGQLVKEVVGQQKPVQELGMQAQ
jgi:UDP-N-acetylmuramate--alanine ligase